MKFKFYLEGVITTTIEADSEEIARGMISDGSFIAEVDEITTVGNEADLYEVDGKHVG